jgi:hypothetical protein
VSTPTPIPQTRYTRTQLERLIDAFLDGHSFPRMPGCPLWEGEKNAAVGVVPVNVNNLWYQARHDLRKLPALLAVRTELDGAINYRSSGSEFQMVAVNTRDLVNRGELKRYLLHGARQRKLMSTAVYKLTEAKAHGETLARALDLGAWDSL